MYTFLKERDKHIYFSTLFPHVKISKIDKERAMKLFNDFKKEMKRKVNRKFSEVFEKVNLSDEETYGIFFDKFLIGLACVSWKNKKKKILRIGVLYVSRKYRNMGIGSIALFLVLKKFSPKKAILSVRENSREKKFYERFGFRDKRRMNIYGEKLCLMECSCKL